MREEAKANPHERWMLRKLERSGLPWTPQARWVWCFFDFWCHRLGVAIEVGGGFHDAAADRVRDETSYRRSGIVTFRVSNGDEAIADRVIAQFTQLPSWNERRVELGMKPIKNAD